MYAWVNVTLRGAHRNITARLGTGHGRRMVPPEDGRVQVARYTMHGLQTLSLRWQFKKRLRHCNTGRTYCSLVEKNWGPEENWGPAPWPRPRTTPACIRHRRTVVCSYEAAHASFVCCLLFHLNSAIAPGVAILHYKKHSALGALPRHDCAPGFHWGLSGSPIPTYNHDILPFILRYI